MLRSLLAAALTATALGTAAPASAVVCVYVYDSVGTFSFEVCVPPSAPAG